MTLRKTAFVLTVGLLAAVIASGCGPQSTVKQQQLNQRDDTQGGTGNKTHSGNLHSK
ncbi:hypothetical protein ACFFNY_04410 [Paenibacillus hodogayensis]|uniref:Lipoprotein n=1 Tax=Paenibacillus hodogayensis TaxID=279208 RepID=A0ABV5VRA8_9BACL